MFLVNTVSAQGIVFQAVQFHFSTVVGKLPSMGRPFSESLKMVIGPQPWDRSFL